MIKEFLNIFKRKPKPKMGFSEFFTTASKEEKERVMNEMLRKANQEQRELLERYDKAFPKGA